MQEMRPQQWLKIPLVFVAIIIAGEARMLSAKAYDSLSLLFGRPIRFVRARPAFGAALVGLAVLSLIAFSISFMMMRQFEALGVFFLDDTLFNSDPKSILDIFSHGARSLSIAYPELRNSIHPYLWLYFGPVIRMVAKVPVLLGLTDLSEPQIRIALGLLVTPLISAIQTFFFGMLLYALNFPFRQILLLSALNVVSFSNLIFDAIPEHFALSNLAVTAMLLAAILSLRSPGWSRARVWFPFGIFSAGITITNCIVLAIVHLATTWSARPLTLFKRLSRSGALGLAVGLFVLGTAYMAGTAIDGRLERGSVRDNFVSRYVREDAASLNGLLRAASAVGNAFAPDRSDIRTVPPTPVPMPYYPELAPPFAEPPYPTFTLEPASGQRPGIGFLGVIALAAIAVGGIFMFARGGACRLAALTSAALMAFNLGLHVMWGDEFFIYSQHWMTPSLLLLSGLFLMAPNLRLVLEAGFAVFLVAVAWNNNGAVEYLLAVMRAGAGFGA
jgi:hypothetical protein